MYRAALALLLALLVAALVAIGLLRSFATDCDGMEREAALSSGSMEACARLPGCRITLHDVRQAAAQYQAVNQCKAWRRIR